MTATKRKIICKTTGKPRSNAGPETQRGRKGPPPLLPNKAAPAPGIVLSPEVAALPFFNRLGPVGVVLGCSFRTVTNLIKAGKLRVVNPLGGRYVGVTRPDLQHCMNTMAGGAYTAPPAPAPKPDGALVRKGRVCTPGKRTRAVDEASA